MKNRNFLTASALAMSVESQAFAQSAIVGIEDLDDRIDDIHENVGDDLADGDDEDRFETDRFSQGWTGSLAFGLSATSGNSDTGDLNLAGRFYYGSGPWNHTLGFAAEFSEDNNIRHREEVYFTYDVNRYFSQELVVSQFEISG